MKILTALLELSQTDRHAAARADSYNVTEQRRQDLNCRHLAAESQNSAVAVKCVCRTQTVKETILKVSGDDPLLALTGKKNWERIEIRKEDFCDKCSPVIPVTHVLADL